MSWFSLNHEIVITNPTAKDCTDLPLSNVLNVLLSDVYAFIPHKIKMAMNFPDQLQVLVFYIKAVLLARETTERDYLTDHFNKYGIAFPLSVLYLLS